MFPICTFLAPILHFVNQIGGHRQFVIIAPGIIPSGGCLSRTTQTSFTAQCTEGQPQRITVPVEGLPRHRALTDSLGVFEMDVEVRHRNTF